MTGSISTGVLYAALDIASFEEPVDSDVLIAACLLHDIGRRGSLKIRPYAMRPWGRKRALAFLVQNGFPPTLRKVASCIEGIGFSPTARRVTPEKKILLA